MNTRIMEKMGYKNEVRLIMEGKCPKCKDIITKFRDELSLKEYKISGLCQECQDEVYR